MSSDLGQLRLRDVTVTYGSTAAVDGVDLSVEAGSIVALLGPSGCGKSTLLRAIAGLEPLAGGSIWWQGRDLDKVPVHRRGIGLMFQDHALFPHRNVADNVGFGLRMAGLGGGERHARVDRLLDLVGLDGFGQRTIGTLSGGQAQRVALARALAPEPRLLLLDEPLGSLDRALRDHLVQEIRTIVRQLGITAIHVTHDHDEAISIADHLALMDEGRISRAGPVEELLAHPGDCQTADALGIDTIWRLPVESGHARSPFGPVAASAGERRLNLLLRPSQVRVSEAGVAGVVKTSHHRGGDWLITCLLAEDRLVTARHHRRLEEGAEVFLTAELAAAELLEE